MFRDFWHGTLLQDKADGSGLNYRRNRYYDPATGRFTQEDPIGLAGGVNLYGFAEGDPVSYSDPYGLCPPQLTGRPCSGWVSAGVGLIPGVGDAIDIAGVIAGRDLLTQETISGAATAGTIVGIILGSGKIGREAGNALLPIGEKALKKMDADPLFHGFSRLLERDILSSAPVLTRANGRAEHLMRGSVNGREGFYHITVKNGEITHRAFIPESDWARYGRQNGLPPAEGIR
jgi:RHS repeat-associated protein